MIKVTSFGPYLVLDVSIHVKKGPKYLAFKVKKLAVLFNYVNG
jgi:hypothetical protein